jgi:hypothetical protein
MIGFAWLTIRQAQEALRKGCLDEAHRLLAQSTVRGHKRFWDLRQQVVRGYIERGERNLRRDNPEGAWHDLLQAEQFDQDITEAIRLRQALERLALAQVRAMLEAGEPLRAAEVANRLGQRTTRHSELGHLEEAAQVWLTAREQAGRGELSQALENLDRVRRLQAGPLPAVETYRAELVGHREVLPALEGQLHEAVQGARWREVLERADRILALAPHHPEARKARARAWKTADHATVAMPSPAEPEASATGGIAQVTGDDPNKRFMLWIDGIGGYLVCLTTRITLGQAAPDNGVDVPLFADVSRLHAAVSRDTEGYLVEAIRPVLVNGNPVDKALLRPNDRVTLGTSCQFLFRQPAAVSTSARLDLVSGHRLPLAVDGVLLMADTLLLGPGPQVHVQIQDLKQTVVLYRNKNSLAIRWPGPFLIDGQKAQERGQLAPNSTVMGEDLAFSFEPY